MVEDPRVCLLVYRPRSTNSSFGWRLMVFARRLLMAKNAETAAISPVAGGTRTLVSQRRAIIGRPEFESRRSTQERARDRVVLRPARIFKQLDVLRRAASIRPTSGLARQQIRRRPASRWIEASVPRRRSTSGCSSRCCWRARAPLSRALSRRGGLFERRGSNSRG